MNIENYVVLDIILVALMLILSAFGYFKGFFSRVFNLLETVVALLAAYLLCGIVGQYIVVYKIEGIASYIGQYVNRIIIFLGLFILFKIILFLLSRLLKPLTFKVVDNVPGNHFLGLVLGLVESVVYGYLLIVFVAMPFFSITQAQIDQTYVAKAITTIVPDMTETVFDFAKEHTPVASIDNSGLSYSVREKGNAYSFITTTKTLYDMNVLSYDVAVDSINELLLELETSDTTLYYELSQKSQIDIALEPFRNDINIDILTRRIM